VAGRSGGELDYDYLRAVGVGDTIAQRAIFKAKVGRV
jgi:hypothetical protein